MRNLNRYFYFLTLILILLTANQIRAQRDYQFIGMDPQNPINWFSNNNWNCTPSPCTFPGADDTARIGTLLPMGGYIIYTPRAVGTAQVTDLNILNGSKLTFTTFTTTGTFNLGDLPTSTATLEAFVSGSVFNNNGTLNVLTTTGSNSLFSGVFTLFNNGTFNLNKLTVSGQTIVNQQGASIFIGDFSIGTGAWTLNNIGLLSKPSSPGTATLNLVAFTNNGTVEVGNGTFHLGATGSTITSNCGRFSTTSPSGILLITAALTANGCPPPVAPPGDTASNFFGLGRIRIMNSFITSGDVNFGFRHPTTSQVTGGNVEFQSDTISGNGNLRIIADAQNPTVFDWLSGTMGGSGTFDVEPFATVNINPPTAGSVGLNGRTVNNFGTIIWTGGDITNSSSAFTFNNQIGAVFEARNNKNFLSFVSPQSVFNNSGIVRKTVGTGATVFGYAYNGIGTVDVQSGTLRFTVNAPNSNNFGGTFNIASGAVVELASSSGGFNFNAGHTTTGTGVFRILNGAIAAVNAPVSFSNLNLAGGTINGSGVTNFVRLSGVATHVFDNGSTLNNTRVLNQGNLLLQSNIFCNNTTTLDNEGTITAPNNTSLRQQAGGAFNFRNFGIVNPGLILGTVFMDGNFTQNASGTLNIDIGGTTPGTQHDQLRVFNGAAGGTGNANLNGRLNVNFVNGFVPAPNQFFQIMTCQTACNGQFSQINSVNIGTDKILVPGYGTNAVSLITTAVNQSINPPVLTRARHEGGGGMTIEGTYSGAPLTTYTITFYRECTATANIGGTNVMTNVNGTVQFSAYSLSDHLGFISARATDAANQTSNLSNCVKVRFLGFSDFDGDDKTDLSIYRPNDSLVPGLSEWWFQRSSDGVTVAYQFGTPTDKITPGDYDGDGKTDVAFWRPSTGEWFVLRSSNLTFFAVPFGISTDKPAPADFDGDGITDFAVFRPSQTLWFINKSSGGVDIIPFGLSNDVPQPADYDGDGKADIAVFRPLGGSGQSEWWILRSTAGLFATPFGTATDKPVPGDYTGDGRADIAFWRPSSGEWFVLRSEDLSFYSAPFGTTGDIPAPGDYDGDGKFDFGIFRPTSTTWFVLRSSGGTVIQQFGLTGDIPVPSAFMP
jgi:hypothetical protein